MEAVRFTPPARAQFLAALAYIKADRPLAAAAFRAKVNRQLSLLLEFPDSGRVIPEFPDLPYREALVDNYRFFYRTKDSVVWIVGTWHDAQIPAEPSEPGGV